MTTTSRQKCVHCGKASLPGLIAGQGLCQYHYDTLQYGKEWVDRCLIERQQQETKAPGSTENLC